MHYIYRFSQTDILLPILYIQFISRAYRQVRMNISAGDHIQNE